MSVKDFVRSEECIDFTMMLFSLRTQFSLEEIPWSSLYTYDTLIDGFLALIGSLIRIIKENFNFF